MNIQNLIHLYPDTYNKRINSVEAVRGCELDRTVWRKWGSLSVWISTFLSLFPVFFLYFLFAIYLISFFAPPFSRLLSLSPFSCFDLPFILCFFLDFSSLPPSFSPFSSHLLFLLCFYLFVPIVLPFFLSFFFYRSHSSAFFLYFALAFFFCSLSLSFLIYFFATYHFTIKDSVTVTSKAGSYTDSIKQDISGSARVSPGREDSRPQTAIKNNILLVFFNRNQQEKEVFTAVRGVDSGHPRGQTVLSITKKNCLSSRVCNPFRLHHNERIWILHWCRYPHESVWGHDSSGSG